MSEPTTVTPPRELVDPAQLRTDISLALQLAKQTRTTRDHLAREAFHVVADLIVSYFAQRGFEVTAPGTANRMHSWPPPTRNPNLTD